MPSDKRKSFTKRKHPMRIHFKFREESKREVRQDLLKNLSENSRCDVRPLFPESEDESLSSMYVAGCPEKKMGKRLTELLKANEDIEFVEEEVQRKLIR
jgi:hypothetical protein